MRSRPYEVVGAEIHYRVVSSSHLCPDLRERLFGAKRRFTFTLTLLSEGLGVHA